MENSNGRSPIHGRMRDQHSDPTMNIFLPLHEPLPFAPSPDVTEESFDLPPLYDTHTSSASPSTTTLDDIHDEPPSGRCAIASIPVELLRSIFVLVPQMQFDGVLSAESASDAGQGSPWISISQVCRHWRSVAIDSKEFWAFVPLKMGRRWVELCLARSNPAPIYIHIDSGYAGRPWYAALALESLRNLWRVRELYQDEFTPQHSWPLSLLTEESLGQKLMRHIEIEPAPLLQRLVMSGVAMRRSETVFGGQAPSLRTLKLTLSYPSILPNSTLFQAPLTSLQLLKCAVFSDSLEVLELLARLPALETLHLSYTRRQGGTLISLHQLPEVSLPRLHEFQLDDGIVFVNELMSHLRFPTNTTLHLGVRRYMVDRTISHILPTLAGILSSHLSAALVADQSFHSLSIHDHEFTLVDPTTSPQEHLPSLPPRLHISLPSHRTVTGLVPRVLPVLPATRATQTLVIDDDEDRMFAEWADISACLTQVRRIELEQRRSVLSLTRALSDATARASIFPRLQMILIPSAYTTEDENFVPGAPGDFPLEHALDTGLLDAISWGLARPRAGAAPIKLGVRRGLTEDVVDSLRDILGSDRGIAVEWDGGNDGIATLCFWFTAEDGPQGV